MILKRRLILLFLAVLVMTSPSEKVRAHEGLAWLSRAVGSARVTAHMIREDEETLLMDGVLHFAYPEGFQVQYLSQEGPVTITACEGLIEVRQGSDVQYSAERYWLFDDFANYIIAFAEYANMPMKWSGTDEVAGYRTKRYVSQEDPKLVLWFHEESGVPFLIRQGKKNLVSVLSFVLDPEKSGNMVSVELELLFARERALLKLDRTSQGWVPVRLIVQEPLGEVHIQFSDWSFDERWALGPFEQLAAIRELNDLFFTYFDQGNWEAALQTAQDLVAVAPQFWHAYLYRAFVYERMDNYLGAVENYQQVLMRQPNNHLALNNLAYHYLLKEVNIAKAVEMAERAVELERKAIYLDTLGYGYYLVGRLEEAKQLLEEALEKAPEEAIEEIRGHLSLVVEALGEQQ